MGLSRVYMLSVACVLALRPGSVCASELVLGPLPPPGPLPELVYSIETDKQVYQLGEQVHITYRALNEGEVNIRLEFLYTPGFGFEVLRDGEEVSAPSLLFPGRYLRVLAPGESYAIEWTWGMNDSDGNPLAPGKYDIVGIAHGGPSPVVVGAQYPGPPATSITIVPEPGMLALVSVSFWLLLRRRMR